MGTEPNCPQCGAALTRGEASLCPVCVSVFAGLSEDRTSTALGGDLFTQNDLATLFPELRISQLIERREELLIYEAEQPGADENLRLTVAPCLDSDERSIKSCMDVLERLQKLNHSNVARIHSCGERDGCLFLLTSNEDGRRLSELIRLGELDSPEALDLVSQLVSAVQELKRAGMNESSPKIEDVLIRDDGTLVVADFGLERMLRATEGGGDKSRTSSGDSASRDASSLGALFYELLAGEALPQPSRQTCADENAVATVGLLEDRVTGYRLLERIGEGGFGMVYLAEQLGPVKRKVALKILKPGMDSAEVISRFQAERQALALLDDPNTAAIYDAGETEKGRPFFAMELVDGETITDFCRVKELGLEPRLDLFLQVCNAVRHAHQRGLIHRDLKPSNILVQSDPESGTKGVGHVKVIDFGIAKATEGALTEETMHTRAAQILGTPNYMSPEQARMEPGSIDTRSDIYSLGAILYELLTGTTPFEPQGEEKLPLDEVFRLIREEDPLRPGDRLRKSPDVPGALTYREVTGDLNWIVMKALRKDPSERYHSVAEFSADVRKFIDDEAVAARPPSVVYSFRKFVRRHRTLAAALAVGLITLLVGSIVSTSQFLKAREHAELAEENARERRTTFSRADFLGSRQLLESDDPRKAVAQLARAVRTDRDNRAASFKLLHTLTKYNFLQPLVPPMKHNASAHEVVFSPEGRLLASVAKNGEAAVWDATTGGVRSLV